MPYASELHPAHRQRTKFYACTCTVLTTIYLKIHTGIEESCRFIIAEAGLIESATNRKKQRCSESRVPTERQDQAMKRVLIMLHHGGITC